MAQVILPLIIFLVPLAYSPGPGNLFFAANGARFGLRATVPASLGYHMATFLVTAAIGFGALAVMEIVPHVFRVLQVAGSIFVLWIAWRFLREDLVSSNAEARPVGFKDGVILLVLNPKAYLIIALMFAQFSGVAEVPSWVFVLTVTAIFTLNNLVAFTAWTLLGDHLSRVFRRPNRARALNLGLGLMLAGVAIWMAISAGP